MMRGLAAGSSFFCNNGMRIESKCPGYFNNMSDKTLTETLPVPEFLAGGGELGERIREFDWSATSLGPVNTWPHSLRTCIRIMLTSRQPIWIGWGKELIKFYNDPYKAIVGGKHPQALGKPASVVWKDIWKDIDPMLRQVMERDEGIYTESQLLIMERNGYAEETYYTFSYTPIPGDNGGTEGMICYNTDDTDKVISGRQLRTLTTLGKRLNDCRSNNEIAVRTIETLAENPHDFPFALFYQAEGDVFRLSHHTALGDALDKVPATFHLADKGFLPEKLSKAAAERQYQVEEQLKATIGEMPSGAWAIPPEKMMVLPVLQSTSKELYGTLVIGLNPYRLLDEKYAGFFSLLSDQIATSFSNVHSLEEERKRAEALAEIDRAKTTFFSNISHEFRTPLTLLLGPVEETLQDDTLTEENRFRMEVAYRNALRMQKLVNTLLDFSRIEAGRLEGQFAQVDIVSLTEDLVSTFRSAIEKAGMELRIRAGEITEPVYADRDMWEKIILNLVSNAFKYTHEGVIEISIAQFNHSVTVAVKDTGIGIPEDHQSRIFDRFHRVENTGGRSQEGSGIGLAMVKELVKLHQGIIEINSKPGEGSTFSVTIPTGNAHLPQDRILAPEKEKVAPVASAFVQEALKWLPDTGNTAVPQEEKETADTQPLLVNGIKPLVLLADDNADMRDYVQRLLAAQFRVVTAVDGHEAFRQALAQKPALVLTDIMMPGLDGFGLLKALREHPETSQIPVVFLSARAGEEAKVEGLDAGADDYLVKPFSARELTGRISNLIRAQQIRLETEKRFRDLVMQAPVSITVLRGREFVVEVANDKYLELVGKKREFFVGRPLWEGLPEVRTQGFDELMAGVLETGESFEGREYEVYLQRNGRRELVYVNFIYSPLKDFNGRVTGIIVVATDVTFQVTARKRIEEQSVILEQEVKNRTRELNLLNGSLRQSNADLQQFAHVTSHDLKEPVRKIKTFSGRLQDEYGELLPGRAHEFLEKVMNATDRIYAMIEGVLKYSTMNAEAQTVSWVNVTETIASIETDLEVYIQQKNAQIHKMQLPQLEGAPILLYQLFYNLINNSLKFAAEDRQPVIIISSEVMREEEQDWVRIEVADNGIGFDQVHADKIFDTFARLNAKDEYEGTGLGLALCKKIAERHHGTLAAHGTRGEGATFTVHLPLRQPHSNI